MRDPSILKKFRQDKPGGQVIFTGGTCVVKILEKFESYGCLSVTDTVKTIGVFDMEVDGVTSGMFLVGMIEMVPSDIETIEENGNKVVKLTFHNGDVFMRTTNAVVEEKNAYYVWMLYIKYGNMMKAMSYEDQAILFDRVSATCGIQFPVDHVVYEVIFAHLSRSIHDLTVAYRNTDMRGPYQRINLSDVAHASRSTSARIIGSYFNDGVNAALVRPNQSSSMIEDMLRQ